MVTHPLSHLMIPKNQITNSNNNQKRRFNKRPYWKESTSSESFGQRSMIVTSYTNKGEFKQMKLKNALKKDFPVSELGQV